MKWAQVVLDCRWGRTPSICANGGASKGGGLGAVAAGAGVADGSWTVPAAVGPEHPPYWMGAAAALKGAEPSRGAVGILVPSQGLSRHYLKGIAQIYT